ncbi:MAG: sugar ABC transporter permease [bacterium]|nr:sugar ABC transporter permease [bacterium]
MFSTFYQKKTCFYLILLVPAVAVYCLALIGPLFLGTIPSAFYDWNIIKAKRDFIGLENFISLFHDKKFLSSLLFTLKLGISTVLLNNVLAFTISYFLNETIFAKGFTRSLFFMPNTIGGIMVSFIWCFLFTNAFPSVCSALGLENLAKISWFGSASMAFVTILIAAVWTGAGFLMVLYLAGLQNISTDILEAAEIDGCTGIKKVLWIQLPLLMPTITINLFVSIAGAFKSFDIPYAMTGGGPADATNTIALNIYKDAFSSYNMGYACAKSVILFLIVMAITCMQLHITRKREVQL